MDLSKYMDGIDDLDKLAEQAGIINPDNKEKEVVDESGTEKTERVLDKNVKYVLKVKYHWLYEARNGYWWHFDQDSNELLENAYILGSDEVDITISGKHTVTASLTRMIQTTSTGNGRNIKRVDTLEGVKLRGIAGTYYNSEYFTPNSPP